MKFQHPDKQINDYKASVASSRQIAEKVTKIRASLPGLM
jgi:hypothetical protein